jgi:site-specific recombinase XerD
VQPALIEAFLASRPRTRPRSYNHLLGVLRCFFAWQVAQERLTHSPVRAHPRRVTCQLKPLLFEPAQIKRLLALASELPDNPRATGRGVVYPLIFSVMYGLGLRVGEIVRLRYCDVDSQRNLLIIDKSKFGKTRLVPFGPLMTQWIAGYLQLGIGRYGPWQPEDPVFSFSTTSVRKPMRTETVSQTFHHLMPELNLSVPPGARQPHLHCLRHSFAVATLLRWYRTGVDPNQRLFHLSTFMGRVRYFLQNLEQQRGNGVRTRNQRLARPPWARIHHLRYSCRRRRPDGKPCKLRPLLHLFQRRHSSQQAPGWSWQPAPRQQEVLEVVLWWIYLSVIATQIWLRIVFIALCLQRKKDVIGI